MLRVFGATVALALTLVMSHQALAYKFLTTVVSPQPESPIRILGCSASLGDRISALEHSSDRGLDDFSSYERLAFENVSARTIQTVEFHFATFDISGSPRDIISVTSNGTFSPGVEIRKGPFQQFNTHGQALDKIECSVERITFADGSQWRR